ncbi:MAG: DUF192 domain-containing protein [Deltaproteobacteria bacterium]|nr:DUF192 domain-containing protein [Deltaproteobacteria bacterium]MBI4373299.1 DUF192 domain-containing protein [Deltaproteobacteria bacterium]
MRRSRGEACLALILFLASCSPSPLEKVVIQTQSGQKVGFKVEIAKRSDERARGLMYRRSLAASHGMLFVFSEESRDPFWMKNTPISLDLIFINQDGVIVDIIEKALPYSEELLIPKVSYFYVLEVAGGTVQRRAIRIGDSAAPLPVRLRSSVLQGRPAAALAAG